MRGNLFNANTNAPYYDRPYWQTNLLLGYSKFIYKKWFIQAQLGTEIWLNSDYFKRINEKIEWNRHTFSLQTGLIF